MVEMLCYMDKMRSRSMKELILKRLRTLSLFLTIKSIRPEIHTILFTCTALIKQQKLSLY